MTKKNPISIFRHLILNIDTSLSVANPLNLILVLVVDKIYSYNTSISQKTCFKRYDTDSYKAKLQQQSNNKQKANQFQFDLITDHTLTCIL